MLHSRNLQSWSETTNAKGKTKLVKFPKQTLISGIDNVSKSTMTGEDFESKAVVMEEEESIKVDFVSSGANGGIPPGGQSSKKGNTVIIRSYDTLWC